MNERRKRFVDAYVRTLNATQSAREAGYKAQRLDQAGYEVLSIPEVRHAVDEKLSQISSAAVGSAQWIVDHAAHIVEESGTDRVSALNLLAKRHPEFRDGITFNQLNLGLTDLTDEQLKLLLEGKPNDQD